MAEELHGLAGHVGRRTEHGVEADGAERQQTGAEDAERKTEIADPIDDERLDGRGVGLGLQVQKPISR